MEVDNQRNARLLYITLKNGEQMKWVELKVLNPYSLGESG